MRWIPKPNIEIDLASAFFKSAQLSEDDAKVIAKLFVGWEYSDVAQAYDISREEIAGLIKNVSKQFQVKKVRGAANPLRQLLSAALAEGMTVKVDDSILKIADSLDPQDQLFLIKIAQGYSDDDIAVDHRGIRSDYQFGKRKKELKGKFRTATLEHAALLCVSSLAAHHYVKVEEWFPNLDAQTAEM